MINKMKAYKNIAELLEAVKNLLEDADDTGCEGMATVGAHSYNKLREAYTNMTGNSTGIEIEEIDHDEEG